MKELFVVSLGILLLSATLFMAWLDNKHGWQLISWFNGKVDNPFNVSPQTNEAKALKEKDQKIAELTERIQVLEKIVTEPAYELNQKLNRL